MEDAEYDELKLIAAICPHQGQWPRRYSHWEKLHEAVDKAREFVRTSYSLMDAIDHDADFSREGKQRQKRKIAAQAIADIQALDSLERAREAVSAMQEKWAAKIGLVLKSPTDAAEAVLHWEVRDRFSSLKDAPARMCFLERFAADPQIASALLTGPAGLTNLWEAERAMLKTKVESHTPPEIIEARSATAKALQEVEAGWQRAQDVIAQRAGLQKTADGSWNEPTDAKNAAA